MKKSVTFLVHNLYFMGGTTRAITNSANLLSKAGYQVHIISVFKGHIEPFFPLNSSIQITPIIDYTKGSKKRMVNILFNRMNHFFPKIFAAKEIHPDEPGIKQFSRFIEKQIIQTIQSVNTDVLISTRASYNLLVAKYANKSVLRIAQEHMLFTKHTDDLQQAIKESYSTFDKVTTLTRADAEQYKFFLPSEKIFVLPNSLPEELENLSVNKKDKIIISAGRFEEEKGFDLLINAIAKIKDNMNTWQVHIYGDGPEKSNLLQLIRDNRLENIIVLNSSTKELHKKMLQSQIYALPSRFEGFGMVLIEAMATSNAVVAFNCPVGPKEIISHNENGVLVDELDIEQFAIALQMLILDETKIKKLANKGKKKSKEYQQQSIIKLWGKLLS